MTRTDFNNPFRPGAGHMPPYLAGRVKEREEFLRLLEQDVILQNMVLTGLRGVGKTVLLETFKPLALEQGWLWVGADLSESTSVNEQATCVRLLTDVAVITSRLPIGPGSRGAGLRQRHGPPRTLNYAELISRFQSTSGLASDKLKAVLEQVWTELGPRDVRGVVFAYDEAQNLADHSSKEEYPLSLLLDVFQSIQRKGVPFLLALTGLPTLFSRLVDARTYSERMFRVVLLERLSAEESRDAICKPIEDSRCPVALDESLIGQIVRESGGYPYFIQFLCREIYDLAIRRAAGKLPLAVALPDILRKLDGDFFSGRWARVTDRQRELLTVIAHLDSSDGEFTVQEIVEKSRDSAIASKPFSASHVGQMLSALADAGLVYKNRHGRYLFAVPLLGRFILRQKELDGSYG